MQIIGSLTNAFVHTIVGISAAPWKLSLIAKVMVNVLHL